MPPKQAFTKSARMFGRIIPTIGGIIILISLFNIYVPVETYRMLFRGNILDLLTGAVVGSIVAGNPVTSYIISGGLMQQGISLAAVTAFMVAWVTVGIIQLPAEIQFLGRRFALWRNFTAFLLSMMVAFFTVLILQIL